MFCAVPEQFPKHLVMRYVPFAVLATCRAAGPHIICSMPVHNMSSYVQSAWHINISRCCVLVGFQDFLYFLQKKKKEAIKEGVAGDTLERFFCPSVAVSVHPSIHGVLVKQCCH